MQQVNAFELGWSIEHNHGVLMNESGDQFALAKLNEAAGPDEDGQYQYFDPETGDLYGEPGPKPEDAYDNLVKYLTELGLNTNLSPVI